MKPLGSRCPKCLVPRAVNAATLSSPPGSPGDRQEAGQMGGAGMALV